jgi:hypothetical protein
MSVAVRQSRIEIPEPIGVVSEELTIAERQRGRDSADQPFSTLVKPTAAQASNFGDLEAAAALVSDGLAARVLLANVASWPGLLWRAYELARDYGVQILPLRTSADGRVDLEVSLEGGPSDV